MLKKEDGDYLIKTARLAIETYLKKGIKIDVPKDCPDYLKNEMGVFVTLNKNDQLRGCIGYPEPIAPLINATIDVAISAAMNDPRFPNLNLSEFKDIDVEITVLTKPEVLTVANPSEYPNKITIGKDGLIVENNFNKGLLLPQVAIEHEMTSKDFLANTCIKAGLNQNCWLEENTKISTFKGQIFKE
ncbi:hypothetical protein MBCUT_17910 [Methanobrevibacter cuticularis]|uniref:Protein MBCUT_17910 n=1 Tax=Methanobrevibacter cuticularis TaxID=47311 RepID=A0A166CY87_9EURY|nr:TIGR00296 family protein [Methanobrevibacter cuticularis]KZX14989.1 hypothetical protein MBCUT_17910 [Methanobrevibacter cuticularis]